MHKTITVFGSSKPDETDEQYKLACELGSLLAKKDLMFAPAVSSV